MRSEAKFYLDEYRKCCAQYRNCPVDQRRHREFYSYMGDAMLRAYIEAANPKKGEQQWKQ